MALKHQGEGFFIFSIPLSCSQQISRHQTFCLNTKLQRWENIEKNKKRNDNKVNNDNNNNSGGNRFIDTIKI